MWFCVERKQFPAPFRQNRVCLERVVFTKSTKILLRIGLPFSEAWKLHHNAARFEAQLTYLFLACKGLGLGWRQLLIPKVGGGGLDLL